MRMHEKSILNAGKPFMLGVAAAASLMLSPMLERNAHAQEAQQTQRAESNRRQFDGMVSQGSEVLSLINSERVLDQSVSPFNMAELRVSAIDQTGVQFTFMMNATGPASPSVERTFRVNFDGTRSGDNSVLRMLGIENLAVFSAPNNQASISFSYTDSLPPGTQLPTTLTMRAQPPQEDSQVLRRPTTDPNRDLALHPFFDRVDVTGRSRDITLNHDWDMGGHVYSNEAGAAAWATLRYAPRASWAQTPLDLRLSGGNMWFGEQAAPFARLFVRPEVDFWRMKATYYGSFATIGNLPSVIYTSHALGLGYSQPIGEDSRLRLGVIAGGGLSYPAWDNIYFDISAGASFQHKNWIVYAMPNFTMAAPNPIMVGYAPYYRPQFENVLFGVQARFLDDMYTARIFGDISTLYQRFGGRLTRSFRMTNDIAVDVWGGLGATHWNDFLGGRWDPVLFAGINVVLGGRVMNSSNSIRYEHLQAGGTRTAVTEIPTQSNPGPYGFGRSGNPAVDAQINDAKNRLLSNDSFSSFQSSYSGASYDSLIMTARFLGAFAQQAAYASNSWNDLNNGNLFSSEVVRVANQSPETIYQFMRRLVDFYNTHDPHTPLPPDLMNGIAMCGGIGYVQSAFLNANGVHTIMATVNTRNGPHFVPIAMPPNGTVLIDYGNTFTTPPGTFDQALRSYEIYRGAPLFRSQLFGGMDGHFLGMYRTGEGRILMNAADLDFPMLLGSDYLGLGPGR